MPVSRNGVQYDGNVRPIRKAMTDELLQQKPDLDEAIASGEVRVNPRANRSKQRISAAKQLAIREFPAL